MAPTSTWFRVGEEFPRRMEYITTELGEKPERKEFTMSKIKIVGDALVIESVLTLDGIKSLEKYNAKALSLRETDEDTGKKVESFRVATSDGKGSINRFGATFSSKSRDENGFATITMGIPDGVEDAKEWVADNFGGAIAKLNQVEAAAPEALAAVAEARAQVMESITVI